MEQNNLNQTKLLETILEHLDIPKSLYEKARNRHRSLAEWLKRDSSTIRRFEPDIHTAVTRKARRLPQTSSSGRGTENSRPSELRTGEARIN